MLHRNRVLGIHSLTGPGTLFTLVFIIVALGFGAFMTRGVTPSLREINPEQSQYKQPIQQAPATARNRLQLTEQSAGPLPVNADCQQIPFVSETPMPDMIYAVSPTPHTTISPGDEIKLYYNDKLPMLIGKDDFGLGLSPLTRSPEHIINPQYGYRMRDVPEWRYVGPIFDPITGELIGHQWEIVRRQTYIPQDENKFPYFPSVFVTYITGNPNDRSGDAQSIILYPPLAQYPETYPPWPMPNGPPPPPYDENWPPYPIPFPFPNVPIEINGTWGRIGDTTETVEKNGINIGQPFANGTNVGPPFTEEFPIISNFKMPGWDFQRRIMEYSTELTWRASDLEYSNGSVTRARGLQPGHTYRLQFIVRNITGVEIAQGCTTYTIE